LRWEQTKQFNVGVDFSLFNGKLDFTADYYKKNTEDLLLNVPLPATSGAEDILRNIGEVENKGFELNLNYTPFSTDNFSWNTNLNFSRNVNEVVSLDGDRDEIPLEGIGIPGGGDAVFLAEGRPIGEIRGFRFLGVWQSSQAAEAATFGSIPGAPRYFDANGDNQIDSDDIVTIGNATPDFIFGWRNELRYKNLNLSFFVQGVQGNDLFNTSTIRSLGADGGGLDPTNAAVLNRWTPSNENTNIPSFEGTINFGQSQSSQFLEDASYIRLKTLILGYSFPSEILDKTGIGAAQIYITGTNLLTITDYTGFDPEASSDVDTRAGFDIATFPSQRSIAIGLNITL